MKSYVNVESLIKQFNYDVLRSATDHQHAVYGPNTRIMEFNKVQVKFDGNASYVLEIVVDTPDHGVVYWVIPRHEVAMHGRFPDGYEPCFSLNSIIKIATLVARGQEFDPGLLCDFDIVLGPELMTTLDEIATRKGQSINRVIAECLREAVLNLETPNYTMASKAIV